MVLGGVERSVRPLGVVWSAVGRHPGGIDNAIAALLTVLAQAQLPIDTAVPIRVTVAVATGALVLRRSAPLPACAVIMVATALMGLSSHPPADFGLYLSIMLAAFTVAAERNLKLASAGGLVLALGVVLHDLRSPEYGSVSGVVSDLMIPIVVWGLGRVVRVQRGRADRSGDLLRKLELERDDLAREAVAFERKRLARELHDVVTHSVSVVVIQAQGAQRVLEGEQPAARQALDTIEEAGRAALTEMRRLLGLLRDDEPERESARRPQPGLDSLGRLAAQVRAAGLAVEIGRSGDDVPLSPALELTVYRIVQEALTNALKYAGQAKVTVAIITAPPDLHVRITDDGPGLTTGTGLSGGRGLLGMRERVAVYGGELTAGSRDGGGFEVCARIPLSEQS
jgi:signal transduction histidine kinase